MASPLSTRSLPDPLDTFMRTCSEIERISVSTRGDDIAILQARTEEAYFRAKAVPRTLQVKMIEGELGYIPGILKYKGVKNPLFSS